MRYARHLWSFMVIGGHRREVFVLLGEVSILRGYLLFSCQSLKKWTMKNCQVIL